MGDDVPEEHTLAYVVGGVIDGEDDTECGGGRNSSSTHSNIEAADAEDEYAKEEDAKEDEAGKEDAEDEHAGGLGEDRFAAYIVDGLADVLLLLLMLMAGGGREDRPP